MNDTIKSKEHVCIQCGTKFTELPGQYADGRFCSKHCAHSYVANSHKGHTKKISCGSCGVEIEVPSNAGAKTLCAECRKRSRAERRRASVWTPDYEYATSRGIKKGNAELALDLQSKGYLPSWMHVAENGTITVDADTVMNMWTDASRDFAVITPIRLVKSTGYIYCVVPGHPRAVGHDYVFLHHIVIENTIGRYLDTDVEAVHHRNMNRLDNSTDNLQLLTHAEHSALHGLLRRDNSNYNLYRCPCCKTLFMKRASSNNRGRFVSCSHSCHARIATRFQYGTADNDIEHYVNANVVDSGSLKELVAKYPEAVVKN